MIRLSMSVEGQTEAEFAVSVLSPHLANFNVSLYRPRLTGLHGRRRGRIPTGGLLNTFGHAFKDIQRWLKEDQKPDARFTMMVDLYSLRTDFPGYEEGMRRATGRERAEALEESLANAMGDPRFIPYIQVHEFEALVLVDPQRLTELYKVPNAQIEALRRECEAFDTPEDINGGQHSHPKDRIKQRVPNYDENVAGPLVAEGIGLPTLRERCPHFGRWLTRLEQLDAENG